MISSWERLFKALGQSTRLRIVKLLSIRPFCVCELETVLGMNQPAISQHLRVLREAGLVMEKREGLWTFYALDRKRLDTAMQQFQAFLEAPLETIPDLAFETRRLHTLDQNPLVTCDREPVLSFFRQLIERTS